MWCIQTSRGPGYDLTDPPACPAEFQFPHQLPFDTSPPTVQQSTHVHDESSVLTSTIEKVKSRSTASLLHNSRGESLSLLIQVLSRFVACSSHTNTGYTESIGAGSTNETSKNKQFSDAKEVSATSNIENDDVVDDDGSNKMKNSFDRNNSNINNNNGDSNVYKNGNKNNTDYSRYPNKDKSENLEFSDPRSEKMKRLQVFRQFGGDKMLAIMVAGNEIDCASDITHDIKTINNSTYNVTQNKERDTTHSISAVSAQRPTAHLPLSDRQFALWVLREAIVGAGEVGSGSGSELEEFMTSLLWLVECPTSSPSLQSNPAVPASAAAAAAVNGSSDCSTLADSSSHSALLHVNPLSSSSSSSSSSTTSQYPSLPTSPVIPSHIRLIILQELRLLMWGNDSKPLLPESNPSKNIRLPLLHVHSPNLLDSSQHQNQSTGSLQSSLFFFRPKKEESTVFQAPRIDPESPLLFSSLGTVCVSNYPTKRALTSLGSIEALLCIVFGAICPPLIKDIVGRHCRTNSASVRAAVCTPCKEHLSECDVEVWWSALSSIGHLTAGCECAKDCVDRCLGEGVFTLSLLPIACTPHTEDITTGPYSEGKDGNKRKTSRPLSVSSVSTGPEMTVITCNAIVSQMLLELCVGGDVCRISTPSRPFIAVTTASFPATASSTITASTCHTLSSSSVPSSSSYSSFLSGVTVSNVVPLPSPSPQTSTHTSHSSLLSSVPPSTHHSSSSSIPSPISTLSLHAPSSHTPPVPSAVPTIKPVNENEGSNSKKDEIAANNTLKRHLLRPSISHHLIRTNFQSALNSKEFLLNQENGRHSKYGHCSDYYTVPIDSDGEIYGPESVPLPPLSALSPFYFTHSDCLNKYQDCLEPRTLSCTYDCFALVSTGVRDSSDECDSVADSPRVRGANGIGSGGAGSGVGMGRVRDTGSTGAFPSSSSSSSPSTDTPSSSSIFNIFSSKKEVRMPTGSMNVPNTTSRRRGSFSTNLSSNSLNAVVPNNSIGTRVGSYRGSSDEYKWENESAKSSSNRQNSRRIHSVTSLTTLRQTLTSDHSTSFPPIYNSDDVIPRKMSMGSVASASQSGYEDQNQSINNSGNNYNNYNNYNNNYNNYNTGNNNNSNSNGTFHTSGSSNNIQLVRKSSNSGLLGNANLGATLGTNIGTNTGSNMGSKSRGTRGSTASSTNNSTHGFGPGLGPGSGPGTGSWNVNGVGPGSGYGLGLGLLGLDNTETGSTCSEMMRNQIKSDVSTGYSNAYVPLFSSLEDGLGHCDISSDILSLLHSALLLKSGLSHEIGEGDEEGGDSVIDFDEAEERDSMVDTESIASGVSAWGGQNRGFGSSFFAAVVGAGSSWMGSGSKVQGPSQSQNVNQRSGQGERQREGQTQREGWGGGQIRPLSSQLLLENNMQASRMHGLTGMPSRARSGTHLSQQMDISMRGSAYGDDTGGIDTSMHSMRRRSIGLGGGGGVGNFGSNAGAGSVTGMSVGVGMGIGGEGGGTGGGGRGHLVVGLSSLSSELQLQSLKRQLLCFLPPAPTYSTHDTNSLPVTKPKSGSFFTLFTSTSPVRLALKSLLGGNRNTVDAKYENTEMLKKSSFQDSFVTTWLPSFSRLKIRSLKCAKILLYLASGEKSAVQSIFLAAFSNLVDGNPYNGSLLTSDSRFLLLLVETLLGLENDDTDWRDCTDGTSGGISGGGGGGEDPFLPSRLMMYGGQRKKNSAIASGLTHLLSQVLRYNIPQVRKKEVTGYDLTFRVILIDVRRMSVRQC